MMNIRVRTKKFIKTAFQIDIGNHFNKVVAHLFDNHHQITVRQGAACNDKKSKLPSPSA